MEDHVKRAVHELNAWTVRLKKGDDRSFLQRTLKSADGASVQVLVIRADMVFGKDHLRSALYHAKKAIKEKENASDSLAMETLLYASGERQLSSAIRKMSIDKETERAVVVQLTAGRFEPQASWSALPDMRVDIAREDLKNYGISDLEMATVDNRHAVELVLERVASVDILKK